MANSAWFNENGARRVAITNGEVSGAESKVVITDPNTGTEVLFTTDMKCNVPIPVTTNNFVSTLINSSALTTIAVAANRFDFMPFIPAYNMTINELGVYVTTGVALAKVYLAIYSDVAGSPATKLVSTPEIDVSVTSSAATSAITPTALKAGTIYWIAILSNSTSTLRAISVTGAMALHDTSFSTTAVNNIRRATYTYGVPPTTAPATTLTASAHPFIRMRVA